MTGDSRSPSFGALIVLLLLSFILVEIEARPLSPSKGTNGGGHIAWHAQIEYLGPSYRGNKFLGKRHEKLFIIKSLHELNEI